MYYYPLLLLTSDDVRNNSLADMFQDELSESNSLKNVLYESLENDKVQKKSLYDLLEIENIISKSILDVFRSNMNILNSDLPAIDIWRIREKTKRLLTILRRKCQDLLHPFDNYTFADNLTKSELWEDSVVLGSETDTQLWNSTVLKRISDIHHYLSKLVDSLEKRVLVGNITLESQNEEFIKTQEIISNLGVISEATRVIYKEIKDYIRLVDHL